MNLSIMAINVKQTRFITLIQDNSSWDEDYLDRLYSNVHFNHGNEKIRYMPFIAHVCAVLDQEFIFNSTGNIDADLS